MSIPVQRVKQAATLSSGTLTTLAIAFTFQNSAYIKIFVNETQISAFSIIGSNITFSPALTAPADIVVYYDVPFSDTGDFSTSEQWSSANVNERFNLLALQIQKLYEKIGIVFPDNEETTVQTAELPNDRANKIFTYDADKNILMVTPDDLTGGIIAEVQGYAEDAENSATSATSAATNAIASATSSANNAIASAGSATNAATSATSAATSATNASTSASSATSSATSATNSATLAQDWAEKATDVTPGHPSAKTWANTASAIAIPIGSITSDKLNYDANDLYVQNNKTGTAPDTLESYTLPYSGFYSIDIEFRYNSGVGPIDIDILYDSTPDPFPLAQNISPSTDIIRSHNSPFILLGNGDVIDINITGTGAFNIDYRLAIVRVK